MKLYSFFRSGPSHRLRIALHLKGLTPDYVPVDLRVDEQAEAPFKAINPQGLVPALELDNGQVLIQSPAIIEWLEERYPTPALLPADPLARAQVRALAAIVGCDVHPINNRRILHGRHAFHSDNGSDSDDKDDVRAEDLGRHLEGCYVNIDDLLNTYRVLARRRGEGAAEGGGDAFAGRWPDLAEQRAGNQTHR